MFRTYGDLLLSFQNYFFDADDTLLDFRQSAKSSFQNVLTKVGFSGDPEKVFLVFEDISKRLWRLYESGVIKKEVIRQERFRQTFETCSLDLNIEETSNLYLQALCDHVLLMPHALEVCEALKKHGKTIGVITNGIGVIQHARFGKSPLKEFIDFYVVAEDDIPPKPNPEMFIKARGLADNPNKESCLMIGDSLVADIYGANKFGISSCWYNPNKIEPAKNRKKNMRPDYTIECLSDVLNV